MERELCGEVSLVSASAASSPREPCGALDVSPIRDQAPAPTRRTTKSPHSQHDQQHDAGVEPSTTSFQTTDATVMTFDTAMSPSPSSPATQQQQQQQQQQQHSINNAHTFSASTASHDRLSGLPPTTLQRVLSRARAIMADAPAAAIPIAAPIAALGAGMPSLAAAQFLLQASIDDDIQACFGDACYSDTPSLSLDSLALPLHLTTSQRWLAVQLGRLLGEGAYGVVYQATVGAQQQPVAVKVVQGVDVVSDGGAAAAQEALLMLQLDHPNVVPALDAYFLVDPQQPSVAHLAIEMPLLSGDLLWHAEKLRDAGVSQLKPENILVSVPPVVDLLLDAMLALRPVDPARCNQLQQALVAQLPLVVDVRVADLGLAGRAPPAGDLVAGEACGTPAFMAPEQTLGSFCTKSDVFAASRTPRDLLSTVCNVPSLPLALLLDHHLGCLSVTVRSMIAKVVQTSEHPFPWVRPTAEVMVLSLDMIVALCLAEQ